MPPHNQWGLDGAVSSADKKVNLKYGNDTNYSDKLFVIEDVYSWRWSTKYYKSASHFS